MQRSLICCFDGYKTYFYSINNTEIKNMESFEDLSVTFHSYSKFGLDTHLERN